MRKSLFSSPLSKIFLLTAFLFAVNRGTVSAQCGLSPFQEPAGVLTPATGVWNIVNVGSGTFADFNVQTGYIYSFYYTSTSALLNYDWDMTFSTTSSIINYDNTNTPVRDSWTGGQACPVRPRPQSLEWYATFNGTVRVNTKTYDNINNLCLNHVPGQGSALLRYKKCPAAADPGGGLNSWNVEAFATTNVNLPNLAARYGYYTDNSIDFNTTSSWAANGNPSQAATWIGCGEIPNDNFTLRARRSGFPCAVYKIYVNNGDDDLQIYVNGNLIHSSACCINSTTQVGNVNGYVLGTGDNMQINLTGVCSGDQTSISIVPQTPMAVNGGTIGGVPDFSNVCEGGVLGNFTNVTSASGGVTGFIGGGTIGYSWEASLDNGATFQTISGVTTDFYNSTTTIPVNGNIIIRRKATDRCGNFNYSNTITLYGRPMPNGNLSPAITTVCPGVEAVLTLNFNPGYEPFSVTFTDGVSNFTRTGVYNGDTIHVISPSSSSIFSFVSVTDSFGCVRTSGFNGNALVQVIQSIVINNVNIDNAQCNGSSDGTITILAVGGQAPLSYSVDNGANFQFSHVFPGLPAGNYDVVVQDNFGCTLANPTNPVVIGEPTAVTHTTTYTDASCANVFDGSVTISASGGTPPYSYTINGGPTQPGSTINGLAAGTYTVYVFDAHNCLDTSSVTISNQYIISVSETAHSDVSCFGGADGSVTVQVNGGIPPYDYSINGVIYQSSGTFSGLSGGTYIIVGRDSKGCTESATVTIVEPGQIGITIDSFTNVLCNGDASGAIYVTTIGGTPGYTFSWSNGEITEDITNASAGVNNVTITDSKGCTGTGSATLSEPFELVLNIASFNHPLCVNDTSGAIDVTANGGVPPYSFSWNNGANTEDLQHLQAGSYTVSVTDANGCQQTISQTLIDPSALVSSIVGTDVTCHGAFNGAADLTVSGGTPPYYYQWSNFQGTEDATALGGGLYYVVITDNNGCQQRDSVTINEPAPLIVSLSVTDITCFNANDGSIASTVTGGTPAYAYLWSSGQNTPNISGLSGGTYALTVTDSNLCSASASGLIINPTAINTSFVINNVSCNLGTDGTVDLIPSGGTAPYTYAWSNGPITEDLTGLSAGVYTLTITDTKNCSKVDSVEVTEPLPLVTSGFIKHVTCAGYQDGFIDITAYGGTLPYSYLWSNGASTEDVAAMPGGNFTVTVTDANNCIVASLYVVIEPTPLVVQLVASDVSCYGGSNGTVAAIPSGGTTPYEYLWNNFITDSFQIGVPAGKYTVLLSDSNGCHTYDSLDIIQPPVINITGTTTDVLCNGQTTGSIDITVTGGTPGYAYDWSFGIFHTEDIDSISAGIYSVTVTDANFCTGADTFSVAQAYNLNYNLSSSSPQCYGANNGFISVDITGGTLPYSYTWNTAPVQHGATAVNLFGGTYTLTVTDSVNCSVTVSATINDPLPIIIDAVSTDSKCSNTPTGSVVVTVTGGVPPFKYELNGILQSSPNFTGLLPGNYVILVRDANSCEGTTTFTVSSPPVFTVDLQAPQFVILEGMTTQLIAYANSSQSPILNYIWNPDSLLSFTNCVDPSNCFNPYATPQFTTVFTVTVMNADSCYASDTVTIIVEHEPSSFIPTAFTPNDDGLNDRFEFDILGATTIEVSVFARWGERLYYNAAQPNGITGANGWDGTKDGKLVPYDTYVYQMKITMFDGKTKDRAGTVTLMN